MCRNDNAFSKLIYETSRPWSFPPINLHDVVSYVETIPIIAGTINIIKNLLS